MKKAFIKETTIENNNAVQKPETLKSGTIFAVSIIRPAFITRENNPRVRIFNGRVNRKIIGLINIFIIPSTTARTRAARRVTVTPGIRYAAKSMASVEIIQ